MPFAVERDVPRAQRILRIRADAIERAVEVGGEILAIHLAVGDVELGAEQLRAARIAIGHVAATRRAGRRGRRLLRIGCCHQRGARGADRSTHECAPVDAYLVFVGHDSPEGYGQAPMMEPMMAKLTTW